jgi:hypothetical protein
MTKTDPVALFSRMERGEVYDAIQAEICTRSLWEFVKDAWHVHHPHIPLVESRPMRIICDHLEAVTAKQIRNLLLNIQPGFAKSLIVSVYWPAWEMIRWPHFQYLCVGALKDVVLRDAVRMQDVINSEWYQSAFIPQWTWSKYQDAKGYYVNTVGGGRMSRSIGMQITGLRGNRRIVDDPIDAGDSKRDSARMEQTNDWLGAAFSNRKSSKLDPLVMIMQRLHEIDPSWWMLENETDVEHVMVPNEWDGVTRYSCLGGYEWRTEEGELACDELCDADETARLKKVLEDDYDGQYQQLPIPKSGQIFQEEYFQRWDPKDLPEFDTIITSWDLNNLKQKRATKDTDPVGGQTWGRAGEDYYLLWRYNRKIGLADSIEAIKKNAADWTGDDLPLKVMRPLSRVLIEGKANGPSAVAVLQSDPQIARLVESVPVQGEDKGQRARAHERTARDSHIYLPPKSSRYAWVDAEWIPLVCGFPRKRHDEDVDCLSQALLWFTQNRAGGFRSW